MRCEPFGPQYSSREEALPRPRFDVLDPERRHQILEGAAGAFAEGGLCGTSLNRLLSKLGMSKSTFYYYFDDKLDLYGAVVGAAVRRFEAVFKQHSSVEVLSAGDFWERLEGSYRDLYAFSSENPVAVALIRTVSDLQAQDREQLGTGLECVGWLRRYLERGQALGVIRADLPIDVLAELAASVDATLGQWLSTNERVGADTVEVRAQTVVDAHRRVLSAEVRFPDDCKTAPTDASLRQPPSPRSGG